MTEEKKHALLSPSSAHRWLRCPPSARYEASFADTASIYAEEGTLAHEVAETELLHTLHLIGEDEYQEKLQQAKTNPLYSKEMLTGAQYYADYVDEIEIGNRHRFIATEIELDLGFIVPESFGTADCVIFSGDTLHVIDYKFGKGVKVEAEGNEQLRLYALGAMRKFEIAYDIKKIALHIVQPRLDHFCQEVVTKHTLTAWAKKIAGIARLAYEGQGSYEPAEKQCRFCKARTECVARQNQMIKLVDKVRKAPRRNPPVGLEYKAKIFAHAKEIKAWLADVENELTQAILSGTQVKGLKVVEGRSLRKITNADGLVKKIIAENLAPEEMCYTRQVLSLTGFSELLGKKVFDEIAEPFIEKPQGKPTLVPSTDKRQDYKPKAIDPREIFN